MYALGCCKVPGIRVSVLAVSELRKLANKIDRVKDARTRVVQGLANKIDRVKNARTD